MTGANHGPSRGAYLVTAGMLALALAFPIALMVLNPTLMFERGWEQYAGTAIYAWAVLMLTNELRRLWRNERAFAIAPRLLGSPGTIDPSDRRFLITRIRQVWNAPTSTQRMELNREGSGLDQEQEAGRFTLTKYILYLLPVIGFIGTVEGISKALMNISRVLPMVKDLDGFMNNLTSVTSALQIAFDSTLLALFLSAALMLAQTLVYRRAEDLLARVDRWVVEHLLAGVEDATQDQTRMMISALDAFARELGAGMGPHVARFSDAVDRLGPALVSLQLGAEAIGRVGDDLAGVGQVNDSLRKGLVALARIEAALVDGAAPDEQLELIRRGVDRSCAAIEGLSGQWSNAFERSSRATQEQLARTLGNLKEALELLQVSIEQGNTLYRSIVKKMLPVYHGPADDLAA